MMRFVRLAAVSAAIFTLGAAAADAQTPAASDPGPFTAEVTAAATLGHKSASAFGGEIDYRLTDTWDVFLEAGHMGNVTTKDVDARARLIAEAVNGTANAVRKANYGDIGAKYKLLPHGAWYPYLAAGIGIASVNTDTSLTVDGGGDVDVSFGADLSGRVTKGFIMIGAGVQRPFHTRFLVDGSYRYGRILARGGVIDGDKGGNTQRLQIGFGVRF